MKKITLFIATAFFAFFHTASASVVYQDFHSNNNLLLNPDVGGGAFEISNDSGKDGVSVESFAGVTIVNGSTPNISGIQSAQMFDVSSGARATWRVTEYDLASQSSYMGFGFFQDGDSVGELDVTPMQISLHVELDLQNDLVELVAGGSFALATYVLPELSFADANGFTILAEFDETGYSIAGTDISVGDDLLDTTNVVINGSWADDGYSLGDFFGEEVAVVSLVNGNGIANAPFSMDLVQLEAIPEPMVISLIGMFGGSLLFLKRLMS